MFYIHFSNWILTYVRRLRGTTNNAVSMAMVKKGAVHCGARSSSTSLKGKTGVAFALFLNQHHANHSLKNAHTHEFTILF